MSDRSVRSETVDLLQELGLKEYEARCFLALTQLPEGTAKEISDISDVPRTRVYDATRVLEAKGLIEVQHSNPQRFRAVSITEATETLRRQYEDRIDTLHSRLESLGPAPEIRDSERLQEVWSLNGAEAMDARATKLLEDATDEIVLLVVDESILTDTLYEALQGAIDRGVNVVLGAVSESVRTHLDGRLPAARVFETELPWLTGDDTDEIGIGRVLLTDRSTLLVSTFHPVDQDPSKAEYGVIATGLGNGVVVLIRRMLATGLEQYDGT